MGAVIVADRYVPRPPPDNIWDRGTSRAVPEQFLPAAPAPFTPNTWVFKGDDAPPWTFWKYQQFGISPQMPVGGGFPFKPSFFRSQDDAPAWDQNRSEFSTVRMPVGGGFPFKPTFWPFGQDDQSLWTVESFLKPQVQALVGGNFPFKPSYWRFGQDDSAVWSGRPVNEPLTLSLAVQVAPLVPKRWVFDYDPHREWVGHSGSAFWALDQSFQSYAPATTRQIPPGDESVVWNGNKSVNNLLLVAQVVTAPFTPSKWQHYAESPEWMARPGAVPENYLPVAAAPFVPSRWKLDNDDGAVWYTKPGSIPEAYQTPGGNFPLIPTRWRFDYNDASLWTVESFAKPPVQALVNGNQPIKPTFWGYNNDDAPTWRGFPVNVGIVQQLIISAPLLPTRWTRDYDERSVWSGAPTNVPITITQPLEPVPAAPTSRGDGAGKYWAAHYRNRVARYQALIEEERLEKEAEQAKAKAVKARSKVKRLEKKPPADEYKIDEALLAAEEARDDALAAAAALEAYRKAELEQDDEEVMALFKSIIEQL